MRCAICNSNNVDLFKDNIHGYCNVCEKKVDLIFDENKKPNSEPQKLKVFFSYGHDKHSDFVKTLAERIGSKTNGRIDVWIDHIKLRVNDNWREEITDGILKSDEVIAFLSQYSTRERGVCLDELAIAIVSKHGMIKSVLLESSDIFTPPALTSEYQWADMSDYNSYLQAGGNEWEKYIDEQAEIIIDMLDSKEIRSYNKELTYLRQKLFLPEIPNELPKFDKLVAKKIIGRKWLEDKVQTWLDDPDGKRIMILYGRPGSGKSMFAAHLQHYNPQVAAALACDFQSDEYSNTDRIIMWLSYKLALRIPEYRRRLLAQFEDDKFNIGCGKDRFNNLILAPLSSSIDGEHAPMIILIDAMDEAKSDDLIRFISDYVDVFTPWVRFLITSRREPEIEECFATYPCIDFEDYANNNEVDLLAYYKCRLDRALSSRDAEEIDNFYKKLVDESEGVFAYAECVCNDILEDISYNPNMKLERYPLPHGLYELFLYTLRRRKFVWFNENGVALNFQGFWQKPLGMIIASSDPLPIDTLKTLMRWGDNEFQAFRAPLTTLLTEENGSLTVFHRSFAEWLDSKAAGKYRTSKSDGLLNLSRTIFDIYEENLIADDVVDEYILLHLTRFLRETGMKKEYESIKTDAVFFDQLFMLENKFRHEHKYRSSLSIAEEVVRVFDGEEGDYCVRRLYLGLFYEGINYYQIHDDHNAKESYEKSLNLITQLVKDNPDDFDCKRALSNTLFETGNALRNIKDFIGAQEKYEKCLKIEYSLAKDFPNVNNQSDIADILDSIAKIYVFLNDYDGAINKYEESVSIRKELIEKQSKNKENINDYAYTLYELSKVFLRAGRITAAKEIIEEALSIHKALVEKYPENVLYSVNLADSIEQAAKVYKQTGRKEDAFFKYDECRKIWERLTNDYPYNARYMSGLTSSLDSIASLLEEKGNHDDAILNLSKSRKIKENHLISFPKDDDCRKDLAVSLFYMGHIYESKDELNSALETYEKCIGIFRDLVKKYPQDSNSRHFLSIVLGRSGIICNKMGDLVEALKKIEHGTEIARQLTFDFPQNPDYKEHLGKLLCDVGYIIFTAKFDFDTIFDKYDESYNIVISLIESNPQNMSYFSDMSICLSRMATLFKCVGHLDDAISTYENALFIDSELAKKYPQVHIYQYNEAYTLKLIGKTYEEKKDFAVAKENYEKSIIILRKLLNEYPQISKYEELLEEVINDIKKLNI